MATSTSTHPSDRQDDVERAETNSTHNEKDQDQTQTPGSRPTMIPYGHGFFDKEIAPLRAIYLKGMIMTGVAIILLIWGVVSIYWGSLWRQNENSHKIEAWVINRDTGIIGTNLTNIFLASATGAPGTLGWKSVDPNDYPTVVEIEHAIAVSESAWIAVEIKQDLTSGLESARDSADASWNPADGIQLYYSEARYQTAVDGQVLGATRGILSQALPSISRALTSQYLSTINNVATLNALANAPQLISDPLEYTSNNLRPYDQPVATAATFVGLIYLMILAFNLTMAGTGLRPVIQGKLRLKSYVLMRLFVPICLYFFISFFFVLLNTPFRVHFGKMFDSYGAGFMTCWMTCFLGMIVLGLSTEAFVTLVTVKFIGFALVFFIIINVSTALIPFDLQDSFYQYGYAMPFYNIRAILIQVIFNTGSRGTLAWHFGILLGWVALLMATLPVWTWLERRREQKAASKPVEHTH